MLQEINVSADKIYWASQNKNKGDKEYYNSLLNK